MLRNKTITELRGIAQSFGIADIFKKDRLQLEQAIHMHQEKMSPEPTIDIPRPEYDARLMLKPPAKKMTAEDANMWIAPYVARGLKFTVSHESWRMMYGKKSDEGTLRMLPRTLMQCAEQVMK